jgi:hypothetical protein
MKKMKPDFAEKIADTLEPNEPSKPSETAVGRSWMDHRLPPAGLLANLAAVLVLLIAFVTLVQLIPRQQMQPLQTDTLVIPGQPIWVLSNPPKRPAAPAAAPPLEQKAAEQISAPTRTP